MRTFVLVYIFVSIGLSLASLFAPFTPGPEVMSWLADSSGRYPVAAALGILFLMYLLPVLIVVFVVSKLRSFGRTKPTDTVLDQATLVVQRERALFGAVFGIDIMVNGTKRGSVMSGRTVEIGVSTGESKVHVKSMGKSTEPITISVDESGVTEMKTGFKLVGDKQELFLSKS